MQEAIDAITEETFSEKIILNFKTNRVLQMTSIFIALILISIPAYSMFSKYHNLDDEYQRDLIYVIGGESGSLSWTSQSDLQLNDDEVFTLTLTYEDFPEEAKNKNIIGLNFIVEVTDYDDDNEETTGLGCAVDSGEDAHDSVSGIVRVPNRELSNFETMDYRSTYVFLFDIPEDAYAGFDSPLFITGYTVKEIEEMFQTGDELLGEYTFEITGNVESGDSTFQCNRQDSSVTINYSLELTWLNVDVIEMDEFW